jgi:hypothetical protein
MNLVGKAFEAGMSFEDACESYFHPSILDKGKFNFGFESSELRLHLGRIPNRVLGEQ